MRLFISVTTVVNFILIDRINIDSVSLLLIFFPLRSKTPVVLEIRPFVTSQKVQVLQGY